MPNISLHNQSHYIDAHAYTKANARIMYANNMKYDDIVLALEIRRHLFIMMIYTILFRPRINDNLFFAFLHSCDTLLHLFSIVSSGETTTLVDIHCVFIAFSSSIVFFLRVK